MAMADSDQLRKLVGALGRWIATGIERASGNDDRNHHRSTRRFDR